MKAYAIGDIHGHIGLLEDIHALIEQDKQENGAAPVVHVGDLVDRGPNSRGVVELLSNGIKAGKDWVVLKGNHDRMFTRFLRDPHEPEPGLREALSWLHPRLGGAETLASYGIRAAGDRPIAPVHAEALEAVPQAHRDFIDGNPTWHRIGDALFVHAGIRPGIAIEDQDETDLVWIRAPFLEHTQSFGPLVVHGHTAIDAPTHYGNRVNIDSSAAYGGPLSAIALEGDEVFHLTAKGRLRLRPKG